jgi:hypothetical protein
MSWKVLSKICGFASIMFVFALWATYVWAGVEISYEVTFILVPCLLLTINSLWVTWAFSRKMVKRKRIALVTLVFSLFLLASCWTTGVLGVFMGEMCAIAAGAVELLGLIAFVTIWTIYAFIRWVAVPTFDWTRKALKKR